jgi:hypothetical protein
MATAEAMGQVEVEEVMVVAMDAVIAEAMGEVGVANR